MYDEEPITEKKLKIMLEQTLRNLNRKQYELKLMLETSSDDSLESWGMSENEFNINFMVRGNQKDIVIYLLILIYVFNK